ncbi:DUF2511 domain-containing protein [Craterilacuibacter sp.]|uniref:DUF2511 domain-containing protein n=1 Tax=Craterilacuibacter sp. TaxID=2870909 RepID=UPI003F2D2E1D
MSYSLSYSARLARNQALHTMTTRHRGLIRLAMTAGLLLSAGLLLAAGLPSKDKLHVTALEYGSEWPLTLTEGDLACYDDGAITLKSMEGTEYALNDKALNGGYRAPLAIWKYDEDMAGGVNMPLTPLIQSGRQLCRTTPS